MFDRLKKPFLTVETGEAYQPLRLVYHLFNKDALTQLFDKLDCVNNNGTDHTWNLFWKNECNELHFESLDSFHKNPDHPVRLGTLNIKDDKFYINLPSFKRACLVVPFFHSVIPHDVAIVHHVDFINKVFAVNERLPHPFTELFKEDELERILEKRVTEYHEMEKRCEHAPSAEEAFNILREYTETEGKKRFPFAERYMFDLSHEEDSDIVFLSFYIFLRGRELVAIKRWLGEMNYTVADLIDETVEEVFGSMDIDIIE